MQLDIRDERRLVNVRSEGFLQRLHACQRTGYASRFGEPGEILGQPIEIEHGCETGIGSAILFQPSADVVLHRQVPAQATPMGVPPPLPQGRQTGLENRYPTQGQVWAKYIHGEPLLSLSLSRKVQPPHHAGPPPMTFFSHSSLSE
jgi:hypothetical protein